MMCVFNAFPGRECGYTAFLLERPAFSSSQHVTAEFTQASTSGFMFRKCNGLSQADFLGVFIVLISRKKIRTTFLDPPENMAKNQRLHHVLAQDAPLQPPKVSSAEA